MKKNNIFRHELNESIQATAALNCLKNRNNHKQLNETSEFDNRFALRKDLKGMANDVTKKAYMLIRKEFGDSMWRQLGIDDCNEKGLIDMLNDYQKHFNITNPQDLANKMLGRKSQEQEEFTAYDDTDGIWMIINLMRKKGMLRAQGIEGRDDVDDGHAIDKAYDLIEQKLNDEGMWIGEDDHEAERFVSFFGEEIAEEAMKSAIHNQQSQEQEENSLDTEYFSDLEEQEAYYENFRAIAELVAGQIDRENGKGVDNNMDTLFAIVREVWNNNPDDLYIWDFDDVQEDDCYKFFDKYYETIKNEYLKREHNNIMDATHDDLFAS